MITSDNSAPPISTLDVTPAFLITIDTECDDAWSRPQEITTRNLSFLPRFQALCERHGFKPTYLTNWEAANDTGYQEFSRDLVARGQGEIGLHLHAWNSPPIVPLTDDDHHHQPYLTEYPADALRQKLSFLTAHLEQTFEQKMLSHRGGRWAFDRVYARALVDNGFIVDCSVTPNVSWRGHPGAPDGEGGSDHAACPDTPFFVDLGSHETGSRLLELPMTIVKRRRAEPERSLRRMLGKQLDRVLWMRPDGRNRAELLELVDIVVKEHRPYLQFTLHSSEFMAGGSPDFQTEVDIERLYGDLEALFDKVGRHFKGETLTRYAQRLL